LIQKAIRSVAVSGFLEGTGNFNINVVSLVFLKNRKFSTKGGQMKESDLFIELLGENVDLTVLILIIFSVLP